MNSVPTLKHAGVGAGVAALLVAPLGWWIRERRAQLHADVAAEDDRAA